MNRNFTGGMMRVGPVDIIVLGFPRSIVDDSVRTSLHDAVCAGSIALLDVVFVRRGPDAQITVLEIGGGIPTAWADLITDPTPMALFSTEDIHLASESIHEGEIAVLAAVEHRWSRRLSAALSQSGGYTILHTPVPHDAVVEAFRADDVAAS